MKQIDVRELASWLADNDRPPPLLLDVREPNEFEYCHIDGSAHIPMHTVPLRSQEIDQDRPVVVICHHGGRSMQVAMFLERQGHEDVHNLLGGVDAWAAQIDPTMRRY
ncbi:MAG: sulfurtransferase [Rhodocyclales bacterium GT-UBC]|nr:MAG: sulfurtransferase [Rhodocyclales bacterium GT-UBC]